MMDITEDVAPLPSEISEALTRPEDLLVWPGAGISVPSGMPAGDQLGRALLELSLDSIKPHTTEQIERIYEAVHRDPDRTLPRLEFILDCLRENLGIEGLKLVLQLFGSEKAQPAEGHKWLAELTKQGTGVLTPNFDDLIEKSGAPPEQIHHYHGIWNKPEECGATLRQVGMGFQRKHEAAVENGLSNSKYVLFLGYSGRDYYDVIPFLKDKRYAESRAIWVDHKARQPFEIQELPERLRLFNEAFGSFIFVSGDTTLLYGPGADTGNASADGVAWRSYTERAFDEAGRLATCLFALDLVGRIGLDEVGLQLLRHLELGEPCFFPTVSDRVRFETQALRQFRNAARYKTLSRRIRRARRVARQLPPNEQRQFLSNLRENYGSCALFGFHPLKLAAMPLRFLRAVRDVKEDRLDSLATIRAVHTELVFLGFVSQVVGPLVPRLGRLYKGLRTELYNVYVARAKDETAELSFDEELNLYLMGQARPDEAAIIAQRSVESDSLKFALIAMRWKLEHTKRKVRPGLDQATLRGVEHAVTIGGAYESLGWLALADLALPDERPVWAEYRRWALSRVELSVFARCVVLWQFRGRAKTTRKLFQGK